MIKETLIVGTLITALVCFYIWSIGSQRAEKILQVSELEYYKSIVENPVAAFKLDGGSCDFVGNETIFGGGGYSKNKYECETIHEVNKDWTIKRY